LAAILALAVHFYASKEEPPVDSQNYFTFLAVVLGAGLAAAAIQPFWAGLRRWVREVFPVIAAAVVLLGAWEIITSGLRLLPMPYFPSPAGVLQSLINDRAMIFDSTWHSLILLV